MKTVRTIVHQMAIDAWGAGTTVLVLCLALEALERGFVSRFFNLLWLMIFVLAASLFVMATHHGVRSDESPHRPAKNAHALLLLGSLSIALAAWLFLPPELRLVWRASASAGILIAVASAWSAFSKHE